MICKLTRFDFSLVTVLQLQYIIALSGSLSLSFLSITLIIYHYFNIIFNNFYFYFY